MEDKSYGWFWGCRFVWSRVNRFLWMKTSRTITDKSKSRLKQRVSILWLFLACLVQLYTYWFSDFFPHRSTCLILFFQLYFILSNKIYVKNIYFLPIKAWFRFMLINCILAQIFCIMQGKNQFFLKQFKWVVCKKGIWIVEFYIFFQTM